MNRRQFLTGSTALLTIAPFAGPEVGANPYPNLYGDRTFRTVAFTRVSLEHARLGQMVITPSFRTVLVDAGIADRVDFVVPGALKT